MAKEKQAKEVLPWEEVKNYLKILLDDVKAHKKKVESLQNSARKLEEFNDLQKLLSQYVAIETMLKACRSLYARE